MPRARPQFSGDKEVRWIAPRNSEIPRGYSQNGFDLMPGDFTPGRARSAAFDAVIQNGPHEQTDSLESPLPASKPQTPVSCVSSDADLFSGEELDRLYREALEVMEAAACDLTDACAALSEIEPEDSASAGRSDVRQEQAAASIISQALPPSSERSSSAQSSEEAALRPNQIIEAALFVGGVSLTTKKLCGLFRGDFDPNFVEQAIEVLNRRYADEGRPYSICLAEGGYRLSLRPELEPVRTRVFGVGPQEVRLSQEVLEILALVAYRQPITRAEVEAAGPENTGSVLRLLLRRELIAIQRCGEKTAEVRYVTTPRFLELFGLGRLDDLPTADEIEMK
jgi:segregation and condensation protein B